MALKATTAISQKPETKITTKPKLQPFLVVFLSVLQKPIHTLQQYVEEVVETNPFIIASAEVEDYQSPEEAETTVDEDFMEFEDLPEDSEMTGETNSLEEPDLQAGLSDPEIWGDDVDEEFGGISYSPSDEEDDWKSNIATPQSFIDALMEQLHLLPLQPAERIAGEIILENLNSRGFLDEKLSIITVEANLTILQENLRRLQQHIASRNSEWKIYQQELQLLAQRLESIRIGDNEYLPIEGWYQQLLQLARLVNFSDLLPLLRETDVERVRQQILYQIDPPGVAATGFQENFIVQLKRKHTQTPATKTAIQILEHAYEDFLHKRFDKIIETLNITQEDLRLALAEIKHLELYPGGGPETTDSSVIVPDFIVQWNEAIQDFTIRLANDYLPEIQLNPAYVEMLKQVEQGGRKKEIQWLRKRYYEADFLIKALELRRKTLLRIMMVIVKRQYDFFRTGDVYKLKALVYKHIAQETGYEISTISRAVAEKYVQTDFGIYPLRFFFSEGVKTTDGHIVSQAAVKAALQELIKNEPRDKPYSDEVLAQKLKEKGYNVARRTVAKYRQQLGIPSARARRQLI